MARSRRSLLIAAYVLTSIPGSLFSLSLDEAVELALQESLNLRKSSLDLALSDYAAKRLWSEIFPSFSLTGGLGYGSPLASGGGFQADQSALSYSLSFGLSLSLNPGIAEGMKRIELAYRSRLLDYEQARTQLEIQITRNFYRLITDRANLSLLEEILGQTERQLERDRVARANGVIGELGYLRSQLAVETARYDLSAAGAAHITALRDFLVLLGIENQNVDSGFALEGRIETYPLEPDPEGLIREYLPKRPDIISQLQTIERLELTKKQNLHSARTPSLDLSAQWRGGSGNAGLSGEFTDNLSGSLSLRVPIDGWIPGTRSSQSLLSADTELEKARLDLKNAETAAAAQIRSLTVNLKNSWHNLEIARLRVRLAERTYELTETGFRNGTVESRVLEDARGDLADARHRLLQGELAYQNLILDLAASLNADWKTFSRSGP